MAPDARRPGRVKGEVRREQIVQAAFTIIARKGVGSLTTAALAREVAVSEANLYRHFRNKDDIMAAAVAQVQEIIVRNLESTISEGGEPVAVLRRFFLLQTRLIAENSGIPRLMFSEELHVHRGVRDRILETMDRVSHRLAGVVKAGQRSGSIRSDIDALTTVLMFVAMIQGLAFRWSLGGFSSSLSRGGMKTWRNYEKLIAAPRQSGRSI